VSGLHNWRDVVLAGSQQQRTSGRTCRATDTPEQSCDERWTEVRYKLSFRILGSRIFKRVRSIHGTYCVWQLWFVWGGSLSGLHQYDKRADRKWQPTVVGTNNDLAYYMPHDNSRCLLPSGL